MKVTKTFSQIKAANIVIFGTGAASSNVISFMKNHFELEASAFLDNDRSKSGSVFQGKSVYHPDWIAKQSVNDLFIVVASSYYTEISKQLSEMGMAEYTHFVNGLEWTKSFEKMILSAYFEPEKKSETSKVRERLAVFCTGDGMDVGYGGDPIHESAICMDLPKKYASYLNHPQHLSGDATNLRWFRDGVLDFVYSSHVLEDFEDTLSVAREWLRVVKPGGHLVLFLPDEQTYRNYCVSQGKQPNQHHIHEHFGLAFLKDKLSELDGIEFIHEAFPVEIYSFELVIRKL